MNNNKKLETVFIATFIFLLIYITLSMVEYAHASPSLQNLNQKVCKVTPATSFLVAPPYSMLVTVITDHADFMFQPFIIPCPQANIGYMAVWYIELLPAVWIILELYLISKKHSRKDE